MNDEDMLPREEPGWLGAFTRYRVEGALRNGTTVVKVNSEPGDTHPDGTPGVILGSISHPDAFNGMIGYFVEWAPRPRVAIGTIALKVKEVPR
jgi:hypothetical protein